MAIRTIKYERALDRHGKFVRIVDAKKGERYFCLCVEPPREMIAKWGEIRTTRYFAHLPNGPCSAGETELHNTAKKLIASGLNMEAKHRFGYVFDVECKGCHQQFQMTLPAEATHAEAERLILAPPQIKPDVTVFDESGNPLVGVEVIVSNPPDEAKLARYRDARVHAFEVRPTWDTVFKLDLGLSGEWVAGQWACENCEQIESMNALWAKRTLDAISPVDSHGPLVRFIGDDSDKRTTAEEDDRWEVVEPIATGLLKRGLFQSEHRPWEFFAKVSSNLWGAVYVQAVFREPPIPFISISPASHSHADWMLFLVEMELSIDGIEIRR
jgi:hypothetical protein